MRTVTGAGVPWMDRPTGATACVAAIGYIKTARASLDAVLKSERFDIGKSCAHTGNLA